MSDLAKRLRATSIATAPEQYKHKGKVYLRGDVAQIDSARFKSQWWGYRMMYALLDNLKAITGWYCMEESCDHRFIAITNQGAFMAKDHVERYHIGKKAKREDTSSLSTGSQPSSESVNAPITFRSLYHSVDSLKFTDEVLRMFIMQHLPFNLLETDEWKRMLKAAQPSLLNIPLSRRTMRRRAQSAFEIRKARIRAMLYASVSKIHLSFDMWSSPNRFAIFSIVAHFIRAIDVQGKTLYRNQAVLLSMKRMTAKHDAEAMS